MSKKLEPRYRIYYTKNTVKITVKEKLDYAVLVYWWLELHEPEIDSHVFEVGNSCLCHSKFKLKTRTIKFKKTDRSADK